MSNRFNDYEFQGPLPDVAPGTLLVASPALFGTPFRKAVVLVVQNNDDGTFGVVLNRPANEQTQFAWQKISGSQEENPNLVQGGPIGGPVFALHQHTSLAELEMPSGICITSQSEKFPQIVAQADPFYRDEFHPDGVSESRQESFESEMFASSNSIPTSSPGTQYRIVFGIAGWRNGQLLNEVHEGLWYPLDGNPEQVFDNPEFMWEKSLRRYSRKMLREVVGIDQIPLDPLLN